MANEIKKIDIFRIKKQFSVDETACMIYRLLHTKCDIEIFIYEVLC